MRSRGRDELHQAVTHGLIRQIWRLDCERDHPMGAQPVHTRELVLSSFPNPLTSCLGTGLSCGLPGQHCSVPLSGLCTQVPENS